MKKGKIMFMDNEPEEISSAVERLKAEGYQVEVFTTMSSAMEDYYRQYYDIFLLDIDMDEKDSDGVEVLKRFQSLHNETKVIMHSARGKGPEWVRATNLHMFGYVSKNEQNTLDHLAELCSEAMEWKENTRIFLPLIKRKEIPVPETCLLWHDERTTLKRQEIISIVQNVFPQVKNADSLTETLDLLENQREQWGSILLVGSNIPVSNQKVMELLRSIFRKEGWPHILLACPVPENSNPDQILPLCNLNPFRLINLEGTWRRDLKEGLESAKTWYRAREIQKADPSALLKLNISLPPEITYAWEDEEMTEEEHEEYLQFLAEQSEQKED